MAGAEAEAKKNNWPVAPRSRCGGRPSPPGRHRPGLSTGFSVLEGGIPIVQDGKIIGSIGVSGVTSQQDAQAAQAGQDALK